MFQKVFLSFLDVSALFTNIPIPVVLKVINSKYAEHINQEGMENIVHMFPSNCSPISHFFLVIAVQHITV